MKLWPHQKEALLRLHNGSLLVGGTGSGKSMTALAYYIATNIKRLYIITTAKKRDSEDWNREATKLGITELVVDSWNNIKKYVGISQSLFIFDEQRVVGYGVWTKSFLKITKKNQWILLSATPADTWMDLVPVFIANGFYRNKTQFVREHVDYAPYIRYPKIVGYRNEEKLKRLRREIFVLMPHEKTTNVYILTIKVKHDKNLLQWTIKNQWNPFTNKPTKSMAEEVAVSRRIINSHPSRAIELVKIQERVQKLIIFYNFNHELEILRTWFTPLTDVGEYNGHNHQPIPTSDNWVYLVQYKSGSEAWECFSTNHMAFYSLTYSYREMIQSRGRIDRHNTHYEDLYYYELMSNSYLDIAIKRAFTNKKNFNIHMLKQKQRKTQML